LHNSELATLEDQATELEERHKKREEELQQVAQDLHEKRECELAVAHRIALEEQTKLEEAKTKIAFLQEHSDKVEKEKALLQDECTRAKVKVQGFLEEKEALVQLIRDMEKHMAAEAELSIGALDFISIAKFLHPSTRAADLGHRQAYGSRNRAVYWGT